MKILVLTICLALTMPLWGQKMHVQILSVNGHVNRISRFVPGIALGNGAATANCGIGGCAGAGSSSTIAIPAHMQDNYAQQINLHLLLPDGRRVDVTCNDRLPGLWDGRTHRCKSPSTNDADADFKGEKVKLTWAVGIDGKKKESEKYVVGRVYPAPTPSGVQ